jgi:Tol biopolymer transport system component
MTAWAPDSGEIVFSAKEGSRAHGIWRVARTGGQPRRIASCRERSGGGCEVDWSPDGKALVIADYWPGHSELYLRELETGRRRELLLQEGGSITRPRFSPDGKWIGYVWRTSLSFEDLNVISAAGGNRRQVGKSSWFDRGFAWSPDSQSLLGYWYHNNEQPHLWKFSLGGGMGEQLSAIEATRDHELTSSRVKGPLAWVRKMSENSLWRMPVSAHTGSPKMLTNSAAVDVDAEWSRVGRMVFRSDRSGDLELWIAKADGSEAWQATHLRGPFVGDAHWAPDGRRIAFTSQVAGNPEIYVIQCEPDKTSCDTPRQMTHSPASDANPTWSNDGQWIYFSSSRTGGFEVWRLRADGTGEAQRVTRKGGYMARESADGKWLYYSKLSQSSDFWRTPLPPQSSESIEYPVFVGAPFKAGATWALGKNELYFYPAFEDPAVKFPPVRAVNLRTHGLRDLAVDNVRLDRGLSLSTDERWLLRSQMDRVSTLIMIGE